MHLRNWFRLSRPALCIILLSGLDDLGLPLENLLDISLPSVCDILRSGPSSIGEVGVRLPSPPLFTPTSVSKSAGEHLLAKLIIVDSNLHYFAQKFYQLAFTLLISIHLLCVVLFNIICKSEHSSIQVADNYCSSILLAQIVSLQDLKRKIWTWTGIPRTSGFLARRSTTWAILVLMPAHVQISLLRRMSLLPGGAVMTLSVIILTTSELTSPYTSMWYSNQVINWNQIS